MKDEHLMEAIEDFIKAIEEQQRYRAAIVHDGHEYYQIDDKDKRFENDRVVFTYPQFVNTSLNMDKGEIYKYIEKLESKR